MKKGQDSEASRSKTFLKLHSRKETQRPFMQSCQDLETSNREGLKMGDTFPIPRRTTSLRGEFKEVFGSTLQNYITSTSAVISLYTCICLQRVLHGFENAKNLVAPQ